MTDANGLPIDIAEEIRHTYCRRCGRDVIAGEGGGWSCPCGAIGNVFFPGCDEVDNPQPIGNERP